MNHRVFALWTLCNAGASPLTDSPQPGNCPISGSPFDSNRESDALRTVSGATPVWLKVRQKCDTVWQKRRLSEFRLLSHVYWLRVWQLSRSHLEDKIFEIFGNLLLVQLPVRLRHFNRARFLNSATFGAALPRFRRFFSRRVSDLEVRKRLPIRKVVVVRANFPKRRTVRLEAPIRTILIS